MKKKLIFSGMILFALVLTTGTFAYTYPGAATTTLHAAMADEAATTCEPSAQQPDWNSILPEDEYAAETLLPCAAGDETDIPFQSPHFGEHWDKVDDDLPPDDGETYVANNDNRYLTDLYNLTDYQNTEGYETINSVTVYFRFADGSHQTVYAKAAIKTNGAVFEGSEQSQTGGAYVTKSHQWTANPATDNPWTWQEINELQAGVSLKAKNKHSLAYCTQVYAVVDYAFAITEGEVPHGNLYDISRHPEYTGDMLFKVYLTNTSNLLKAYKYLNMKLYVEHSLEAGKTPDYQILSIENGVAQFNIEGGSSANYTIEVIGGSYRLTSDNPAEWGAGWSITPEVYCEVTQR